MNAALPPLRTLQREHALLLLDTAEFETLLGRGELVLPQRHREHFTRVLRRSDRWPALTGDGAGRLVQTTVADGKISIAPAQTEIQTIIPQRRPVTLVQAWPRNKALALILQKTAELGVAQIILADSEHSAPHSEKTERIMAILENACMQAYNPVKPRLSFAPLIAAENFAGRQCFFGDIEAGLPLGQIMLTPGKSACFVNGPEGGFSPAETEALRKTATGVLLSENVLRSETAAIIAVGQLCRNP